MGANSAGASCPHCGSTRLANVSGDTVCEECGTVLEERAIDPHPEWRSYTREDWESRARTGGRTGPLNTPAQYNTRIFPSDTKRDRKARQLMIWQLRNVFQRAADRSLAVADAETKRIGAALGLPQHVVEEALVLFERARQMGLVRGYGLKSAAAATLLMAVRKTNLPVSLTQVLQYVDNKKEAAHLFRLLVEKMGVELPVPDPVQYVDRIVATLGLSREAAELARQILVRAKRMGLTAGKSPAGLAGAAVYLAALEHGPKKTQKVVAAAAGVTEVTVRNRYHELVEALGLTAKHNET